MAADDYSRPNVATAQMALAAAMVAMKAQRPAASAPTQVLRLARQTHVSR